MFRFLGWFRIRSRNMALPTCIKCGNKLFTLHKERANSALGTPSYLIVACSKQGCGTPVGAVADPGLLFDIDWKLDKIMQALKIR